MSVSFSTSEVLFRLTSFSPVAFWECFVLYFGYSIWFVGAVRALYDKSVPFGFSFRVFVSYSCTAMVAITARAL